VKWRANRGQEFVIGGYIPNGDALDSILVGYYKGPDLMYAASVPARIPEFRGALLAHFEELRAPRCPFAISQSVLKALGWASPPSSGPMPPADNQKLVHDIFKEIVEVPSVQM
jgi:hypothetical protein